MNSQDYGKAYESGLRKTQRFLLCKGAFPEEAEELAQNAWVRGWERIGQLRNDDRVLPWVNSIAYHEFCTRRRQTLREAELTEDHGIDMTAGVRADAEKILGMFTARDRLLVIGRYVDGHTNPELAAMYGISDVGIRVRIHRAKITARSRVKKKMGCKAPAPPPISAYEQLLRDVCREFDISWLDLRHGSVNSLAMLAAVRVSRRKQVPFDIICPMLGLRRGQAQVAALRADMLQKRDPQFRKRLEAVLKC